MRHNARPTSQDLLRALPLRASSPAGSLLIFSPCLPSFLRDLALPSYPYPSTLPLPPQHLHRKILFTHTPSPPAPLPPPPHKIERAAVGSAVITYSCCYAGHEVEEIVLRTAVGGMRKTER